MVTDTRQQDGQCAVDPASLAVYWSHVDTAVRVLTDNYPAVKVLIKILTLSPFLVSPASFLLVSVLFSIPTVFHRFRSLYHCLLLFAPHLSFCFVVTFLCLPSFYPCLLLSVLLSFSCHVFFFFLSVHLPACLCVFFLAPLYLCLTQTSRRSSHRCEWSTIREQHHALERCYFWVSHALNPTPPCYLYCATVIVMHRFPLPTHPFCNI